MAKAPVPPPVTEDAFVTDRKNFLKSFTSATAATAIAVAVILILLAVFLL